MFESDRQEINRERLADSLQAVISLRLLSGKDGRGRIPVIEILRVTRTIRECLRTGRLSEVPDLMRKGRDLYNMQVFDQHLLDLVNAGLVSYEAAIYASSNPEEFGTQPQYNGVTGGGFESSRSDLDRNPSGSLRHILGKVALLAQLSTMSACLHSRPLPASIAVRADLLAAARTWCLARSYDCDVGASPRFAPLSHRLGSLADAFEDFFAGGEALFDEKGEEFAEDVFVAGHEGFEL